MKKPHEIGSALENRAAEVLSGERVKQSGAGNFYKLDVRGLNFIWSCKATTKSYLKVTGELMWEAYRAARGVRGAGDGVIPGIVAEVDGEAVVVLRLEDFAQLITDTPEIARIAPAKSATRRAKAHASALD